MLSILGVGKAHPTTVIDNDFLESLDIGTNNEWIMERVGIKTRHTVLPLDYIRKTRNLDLRATAEAAEMTAADLGAEASKMALAHAGITPSAIGMVICGTCIPQMAIPAHSCLIAAKLGINASSFDLNSACSSFSAQVHFLNGMQADHLPEYILLIQTETMTLSVNYNDRNTAVLFGDGAAAQVLSTRHQGPLRVLASSFESDPSGWDKVIIPAHGHFFQEGRAVQRFAITETVETFQKLCSKVKMPSGPYFIGHQANLRMLETSCTRIGVDPEKHFYNIDRYGNCGSAGGPTVLVESWNQFHSGDYLALVTVGSGLSWGGAIMQFGDCS